MSLTKLSDGENPYIDEFLICCLLLGSPVFIPLSMGNHPNSQRFWRQIGATFLAAFETIFPGALVFLWKKRPLEDPPTAAQVVVHSNNFMALLYTGLAFGSVLTVYYLFSAISLLRKDKKVSLTQSSDERGTSMSKRACTRKIAKMLLSAREMHTEPAQPDRVLGKDLTTSKKLDLKTKSDPVFQTYVLQGEGREPCASWSWVLQNLLSKQLFEEEGVWLPSRVWVFQCIQIVVLVLYIILANLTISTLIVNADESTTELPDGLPSWIYGKKNKSSQHVADIPS